MLHFSGTDSYIATRELMIAVDAAVNLQRPLLIKGDPGTGKTILAYEIARFYNLPLYTWHITSTTKAQQGLYDHTMLFRDCGTRSWGMQR